MSIHLHIEESPFYFAFYFKLQATAVFFQSA